MEVGLCEIITSDKRSFLMSSKRVNQREDFCTIKQDLGEELPLFSHSGSCVQFVLCPDAKTNTGTNDLRVITYHKREWHNQYISGIFVK